MATTARSHGGNDDGAPRELFTRPTEWDLPWCSRPRHHKRPAARTDLVDLRNNDLPSEGVGDDPYLLYVFATSNHDAAGNLAGPPSELGGRRVIGAEEGNADFRQDASRHADSGVARRHVGQNEGARGDRRFVPDRYRPENTGVGGDIDVIADFGVVGSEVRARTSCSSTRILGVRATRTCEACWMSRPAPISASG